MDTKVKCDDMTLMQCTTHEHTHAHLVPKYFRLMSHLFVVELQALHLYGEETSIITRIHGDKNTR